MKKGFAIILGAVVFLLAACAPQNKTADPTEVRVQMIEAAEADVQETEAAAAQEPEEEIYMGGMDMINPWVDSDRAGVLEATGFNLAAPAGASNVAYSYMPSTGMAQLNFNLDNAGWVYRMKPADALEDISGVYCDWDFTEKTKVAGMDAMEYSYTYQPEEESVDSLDCTRVINWYDAQNKVTHSLVVFGKDLNGMDTTVYAEKLFRLAANGINAANAPESDGIGPISAEEAKGYRDTDLYKSFLGHHVSGYDGSEITVEEGGADGRLKVAVSLFRLCSLDDGVGIYENGVVSFSATDPSGNKIRCCLYYDSDNRLCMEVEDSTWIYLPVGTVISGFDDGQPLLYSSP